MYKCVYFILTLIFLSIQHAETQSLDQILKRHFEASGQERFSKVTTVRSAGKALQMGMELPFIQIQKRPDKMYLEIDIQGMKIIQAYDGETGWAVEPWMTPDPRELTGPELRNLGQMASIDSDLVDWKEKGYMLELMGKESFEGREIFRLELSKSDGESYQFYIDSESYLVKRMVTRTNYEGNVVEGETILSDYRNIDGIRVPFKIESRYGGQTMMTNLIEKVEFDVVIEEEVFSRP